MKLTNSTYPTGTMFYYLRNLQGDIIALYDGQCNLVAKYVYDSWGKLISIKDGSGNDVTNNTSHVGYINPLRYRGYYYDNETGLYYVTSRYYNPEIGRFLNADGLVSTGQGLLAHNMYAYCNNNAVMFSDSSGFGAAPQLQPDFYVIIGGAAASSGGIGAIVAIGIGLIGSVGAISMGIGLFSNVTPIDPPLNSQPQQNSRIQPTPQPETRQGPQATPRQVPQPTPTDDKDKRKVYFPQNPNDFNPRGLVPTERPGTKNGILIQWMIGKVEIFRWDENINYKNGPHYHIGGVLDIDGEPEHFYPGMEVPEPYATIYFGGYQ